MSLYNALFGRNPASRLLLAMLNLTEGDVGRFRDCYLKRDEETKKLTIVIYTRNGGGNRDDYEAVTEALQVHPAYLSDADDDFDCTYASYFFKVPEAFAATAEELAGLGAESDVSPQDRFQALIANLQKGDQTDPAVIKAMEVGKDIFAKVSEQMKAGGGKVEV
jgi:hypothetical protein